MNWIQNYIKLSIKNQTLYLFRILIKNIIKLLRRPLFFQGIFNSIKPWWRHHLTKNMELLKGKMLKS